VTAQASWIASPVSNEGVRRRMMKAKLLLQCGVAVIVIAAMCPADDVRALLDAVKRRDHRVLKSLIDAKADVNAAQPDGATALAWQSTWMILRRRRCCWRQARRSTRRMSTAKRRSRSPVAQGTKLS